MTSREQLFALYAEWRRLTEDEGAAIQACAWQRVDECQATKSQLQEEIVQTTESLQVEAYAAGSDWTTIERELRRTVQELIVLESRNSELLTRQRRESMDQQRELNRAVRNLRQVARVYTSSATPVWQSYS